MVRTSQIAGNEDFDRLAADPGHSSVMGPGVLRVLRPGAGQQDWFPGKRRTVQYYAAESYPGSDIIDSFHNSGHFSFQGPTSPVEPLGGICLPNSGSFLRFHQIIRTFLKNFAEKFGM